jgi:predicted HTH domain antitoxin
MDLIKNIIQIIKKELNEEKILFVIDGYSKKYDKNDSLKKIKELIPKNYLFII